MSRDGVTGFCFILGFDNFVSIGHFRVAKGTGRVSNSK